MSLVEKKGNLKVSTWQYGFHHTRVIIILGVYSFLAGVTNEDNGFCLCLRSVFLSGEKDNNKRKRFRKKVKDTDTGENECCVGLYKEKF